ncbi:MAG: DUF938 domain-containing protein [Pseudomonadota bacterium]
MTDLRQFAPSTARNRAPIVEVLQRVLPAEGAALELASGSGEHAVFFAANLPGWTWQPSDSEAAAHTSIAAWIEADNVTNVKTPVAIDVREGAWGVESAAPFDAVLAINMIHISPWASTLGLLAGAARLLRPDGVLFLYGPYRRGGAHTAPSNEAFDASLKARNAEWGVRDVEALIDEAKARGLTLKEIAEMPANNLSVVLTRTSSTATNR